MLDSGAELHYGKLLIATGSAARRLPFLEGYENVHGLRTLADARLGGGAQQQLDLLLLIPPGRTVGDRLFSTGLACDAVVVGVSTSPATAWLRGSGLGESGVRTYTSGRARLPGVFAAGDASVPFDPRFGAHGRTEHWDAAAWQGAAAARAMLGEYPGTPPLPSFWSDQYGLRSSTSATRTTPMQSWSRAIPASATSKPSSPAAASRSPASPSAVPARSQL